MSRPRDDVSLLARDLVSWFRHHRRDLPWRHRRTPYRVWVSEIMLQQTTVRAVVPHYERFVRRFPTVRRLAGAPLAEVLAAWSGLGYYRRARHLHAAAQAVVQRHGGRVPADRAAILALPGIGPYTAGAILSIAHGRPEPVLDGNVQRVLCRLRGERRDPRATAVATELWQEARLLVEAASAPGDLNEALMELGATICTPAAPGCASCPVSRACMARVSGLTGVIPPPRRTRPPVKVRQRVALVRRDGRLLMRRRGRTGLMDGLWEFPEIESSGRAHRLSDGGPFVRPTARLGSIRHAITYRRIDVDIVEAALLGEADGARYRWVAPGAARRLPVSSLVAKILARAAAPATPSAAPAPRRPAPRRPVV